MSVKIFEGREVQRFLDRISNLDGEGGDARVKLVVRRILSDLFKTIEDLDLSPDEIWAGINYLNFLGRRNESALLAAGLGLEHYIDLRLDEEDRIAGIDGGTPRTIEGPLYVAGAPVHEGSARMDKDPDPHAAPLLIHGCITGPQGQPLAGALVEAWHCNSSGFYSHFDPTGEQSPFNLRSAIRTGEDGSYRFRTLMPVGYGCPPDGPTQALLNQLARHGRRPAHVHFFVTAPGCRKLTTQFNIEGDPLIWDDFAYATREELIPPVMDRHDGRAHGLDGDGYKEIRFDMQLTALVDGRDNQVVHRLRASL